MIKVVWSYTGKKDGNPMPKYWKLNKENSRNRNVRRSISMLEERKNPLFSKNDSVTLFIYFVLIEFIHIKNKIYIFNVFRIVTVSKPTY